MYLENVVVDATDPQALGRFWEAALGTERLTDEPDVFETRLAVPGGPALDLCFQRVPEPPREPHRLRLDLAGADDPHAVAERLVGLGAGRADAAGGPLVLLTDPEGNTFGVREAAPDGTGPLASVCLDVADPDRERGFWSWLTGWVPSAEVVHGLRHPTHRGPVLELCPQAAPRGSQKNRMHLDLRLEPGDDPDAVADGITARGGRELDPGWGDLPWRVFADPSGNELCVLPSRG